MSFSTPLIAPRSHFVSSSSFHPHSLGVTSQIIFVQFKFQSPLLYLLSLKHNFSSTERVLFFDQPAPLPNYPRSPRVDTLKSYCDFSFLFLRCSILFIKSHICPSCHPLPHTLILATQLPSHLPKHSISLPQLIFCSRICNGFLMSDLRQATYSSAWLSTFSKSYTNMTYPTLFPTTSQKIISFFLCSILSSFPMTTLLLSSLSIPTLTIKIIT